MVTLYKSDDKLTQNEPEVILHNVDISKQYTLTIANDAKEMAKRLTPKNYFERVKEEGCGESGGVLFGEVILGKHYHCTPK